MASYGHHVQSVDGNAILKLQITDTAAAKGIIACCYIFVGIYGVTWVSPTSSLTYNLRSCTAPAFKICLTDRTHNRLLWAGSTPPKSSP